MRFIWLIATLAGCSAGRAYEVRYEAIYRGNSNECQATGACCPVVQTDWATDASELALVMPRLADDIDRPDGFPEDVDFAQVAVLVLVMEFCSEAGLLRPSALRHDPESGVSGRVRIKPISSSGLSDSWTLVTYVETPQAWVGDVRLWVD